MKVTPPAPCEKIALYGAPDGTTARVPVPAGVVPEGLLSIYGRTRFLVDVIDADDPRTDAQIAEAAIEKQRGAA